jgi:hypothetical protein
MTTAQVHRGPDAVSVRFGAHDITVPEPLAGLVTELIDTGRRYVGVGAPTASPWLFPGHGLERLPKRRAYRSANARSHTSKHLRLAHE